MPSTNRRGTPNRVHRPPIRPPARIIDTVWAPSRGPAQRARAEFVDQERDEQDVDRADAEHHDRDAAERGDQRPRSADDPQPVGHRTAEALRLAFATASAAGRPSSRVTPQTSTTDTRNVAASTTRTGQTTPARPAIRPGHPGADDAGDHARRLPDGVRDEQALGGDDARQHRHPGRREEGADDRLEAASANRSGTPLAVAAKTIASTTIAAQAVGREHDPAPVVPVGPAPGEQADGDRRQATTIDIRAIAAVEPARSRTSRNSARQVIPSPTSEIAWAR